MIFYFFEMNFVYREIQKDKNLEGESSAAAWDLNLCYTPPY